MVRSALTYRRVCAKLRLLRHFVTHRVRCGKKRFSVLTYTYKQKSVATHMGHDTYLILLRCSSLTPRIICSSSMQQLGAEAGGFEPPVRLPVRQFSKLLVSATHPHFLLGFAGTKVLLLFDLANSRRKTRFRKSYTWGLRHLGVSQKR